VSLLTRAAERSGPLACPPIPWGILLLLVPSWLTYLLVERDELDTGHPLFFYPPNLTQDPAAVLVNLLVTPIVNTQTDQILLVTGLLLLFGIRVEWQYGTRATLGIFWLATAVAAVFSAALLHVLYPLFPDVYMVAEGGWYRVFNGGSAGSYALLAAYSVTSPRRWLWIGAFVLWEPGFWLLITGDYTPVFHISAFLTGWLAAWWLIRRRERSGP
jgi:membrane associated rhomboid family serine protease